MFVDEFVFFQYSLENHVQYKFIEKFFFMLILWFQVEWNQKKNLSILNVMFHNITEWLTVKRKKNPNRTN